MLFFLPLLGGARQSLSLSQLVEEYGDRRAPQSAAALLRAMPAFSPGERHIASFLLGNDFAELGLDDLAARQWVVLLDSADLGGAAFVALARLYDDTQDSDALLVRAKQARWDEVPAADMAEAVYRVARACMREGRYAQARDWLARISEDSPYYPASRFLLAQTEYALGRTGAALDAAERVFRVPARTTSDQWLQDRTAILAGDMLTEIGLYPEAAGVLQWPSSASPFRQRADRDRLLAVALFSGGDEASAERAGRSEENALARAASAPHERADELRRVWPSARMSRERRRWAAGAARTASDADRGMLWRVPLEVLWRSLPPVVVYQMFRRATHEDARQEQAVAADARFFFTPRPEVARLLVALALASEPASPDDCAGRAASAIAARAAGPLAGTEPPVTWGELQALAARCANCDECEPTDNAALRSLLEAKLDAAIAADALRRTREIREQRFVVSTAIAAAQSERLSLLHDAAGDDR